MSGGRVRPCDRAPVPLAVRGIGTGREYSISAYGVGMNGKRRNQRHTALAPLAIHEIGIICPDMGTETPKMPPKNQKVQL